MKNISLQKSNENAADAEMSGWLVLHALVHCGSKKPAPLRNFK